MIESKVKKILIAKYFIIRDFPLDNYKHYLSDKYIKFYNDEIDSLSEQIYSKALTLMVDNNAIPLRYDYGKIAMLNLVNNLPKYMDNIWSTYFMYDNYSIKDTALLRQNLNKYDYVFVNLFVSSMHTMNGRDNETIKWLEGISKSIT